MPSPSSALATLGASIKAIVPFVDKIPFADYGGGYGGFVGFMPRGITQVYGGGNESPINFDEYVADPLQNTVVASCVDAISQALPDAPFYLENRQRVKDEETGETSMQWVRVDDHPALSRLRHPNDDMSEKDLWSLTTAFDSTIGEAIWIVEMNLAGTQPRDIWPYSPSKVVARGTREDFIAWYDVTAEDGSVLKVPAEQVIHFRHMPSPYNMRRGWAPLQTGGVQLAGSNAGATFTTSLLMNSAVSSWLISLKEGGEQKVGNADFQNFIDAMRRKYQGNVRTAGGIDGLNLPLEVKNMAYSPGEMNIDILLAYFKETIHMLMGVDQAITGGTKDLPYANLREVKEDFWERRIKPLKDGQAGTLTRQYLPLFGLQEDEWRVCVDYSRVPALQEDVDALHKRWRDHLSAGGIDVFTFQSKIGEKPSEDLKGKYIKPSAPLGTTENTPTSDTALPQLEGKAFLEETDRGLEIKRFDPNQPRDENGRWGGGSGTAGKGNAASRIGLRDATDAERKEYGIPPAWTDVKISTDPKSDVSATGKDKKGRLQVRYSESYAESQKGAKWGRIEAFHAKRPELIKAMNDEISSDGKNAHQALTLRLISLTGLRNGGDEGGGDAKAYGASNLLTSHARIEGDTVHLDFVGKEGVRQRHSFTDSVLARHIEKRQSEGKSTVFDGDSGKTLSYLKKISNGDFKVHDFRTHYGTTLGHAVSRRIIAKEGAPKDEKELAAHKLRVAKVVSRDLGNGAAMARDNYIHPNVFQAAQDGIKSA